MVNISLLQGAMKNRNISYEQAAEVLGIDRSTFYRRLNRDGARFTVEEVSKLSAMLKLSAKEMQNIFFDRELA